MFDAQQGARRPSLARTRRVMAGLVATVLGASTLSGCTGVESEPTSPPSSESAATATPPPSPSPSAELPSPSTSPSPDGIDALLVEPDEMKQVDEAGAIAAAKYFVHLFEYAYSTGDLEKWEAMSGPNCAYCEVISEGVQDVHDRGGRVEFERFEWVGDAEVRRVPSRSMWEVSLEAIEGASTEYDKNGQVVLESDGGPVSIRLGVVHELGAWMISGVETTNHG